MIEIRKRPGLRQRIAYYRSRHGRKFGAALFALRAMAQARMAEYKTRWSYRGRLSASGDEGNDLIRERILARIPSAIGKIGGTECPIVAHRLKNPVLPVPPHLAARLYAVSGVFPVREEDLQEFCRIYLDALDRVDILAVWGNPGESLIVRGHCPAARLVPLESLDPYYFGIPWSSALAGLTVLVVHPFVDTLARQLRQNRAGIWPNPLVLPAFEAKLLAMPHYPILRPSGFASWFELVDNLKEKIAASSFDVALIGAGAASLPLAAHVKSLGKIAIHTGGATQLLFGIRGRRWDNSGTFDHVYNEFWTRPSAADTPPNIELVEDGCYW